MSLIHWGPDDLLHRLDDVLTVYGAAMSYPSGLTSSRRGFIASHVHRPGFRAVATVDDDDRLLGFGYGYTSVTGQWWHDQVRGSMRQPAIEHWLTDCFELVELHVTPQAQGHGTGYRQLNELLDGVKARTVLLSTPEVPQEASRAWRLYRRVGFVDILRHFYFPGDERLFAILGSDLPLAAPEPTTP